MNLLFAEVTTIYTVNRRRELNRKVHKIEIENDNDFLVGKHYIQKFDLLFI